MEMATRALPRAAAQTVRAAGVADVGQVFATLTLAFAADPPCRWMYPDPAAYLRHFPAFARAFGGASLEHRTALHCGAGAALWLAPGDAPDAEGLTDVVETTVGEREQGGAWSLFAEMDRLHPRAPHWYLPLIGVEPAWQGRGLGEAMLAPVLAQCDADGLPAYLEATSARSVTLYERLGFRRVATIDIGGCPRIVAMLRRPRENLSRGERLQT